MNAGELSGFIVWAALGGLIVAILLGLLGTGDTLRQLGDFLATLR